MREKLITAKCEKDVENIYREELKKYWKNSHITSEYKTDGLLEAGDVRTLLEFKYSESFKEKLTQCNVLMQLLYYIKKFETEGKKLPNTVFVGDVDECFALQTKAIEKYLSHNINWNIAPSESHKHNIETIQAMVNDVDILPFVFDIDENFDIRTVIRKIKELSVGLVYKVKITQHNVTTIFDYFEKNVIHGVVMTTNEKANLFVQIIINKNDNYIHPKKTNILVTRGWGEIKVPANQFKSFFSYFEDSYSPKQCEELTALVDRLVEDTTRRKKGEFFTPALFVDKAHEYLSKTFGDDWKEKYVVWDCCSGTMNLTRDYNFKKLYCSTLEQSDLDTAEQMGYNKEAVKFQFDFLNDSDDKLPQELKEAIESEKEVLFIINPPYATSANRDETSKKDVGNTKTNKEMLEDGWGKASQNLYAQFLYKIAKYQEKNKNVKIGIFCKPLYFSGTSYKIFREKFFDVFSFEGGFIFEAAHFSDVSNKWGITFSVFSNKKNTRKFKHDVLEVNDKFELECFGEKDIYNLDNENPASEWVREEVKGLKTFDCPQISSAVKVKQNGIGKITENSIGYMNNGGNNVFQNTEMVNICSSGYSNGHGVQIIKDNFFKITSLFTARRTITGAYANYLNDKDEYIAPNESHDQYKQFMYDSLVYALFNNASQQSSLRNVLYKGKQYDIKNEFFWIPKDEMLNLANNANFNEMYTDARTDSERYVTELLKTIYPHLSKDAKDVLGLATTLVKKSIRERKLLSESNPNYNLQAWDAGYAQLKLVWQEYFKEDFKTFRSLYKDFENRMRPMVYELGFLKV